MRLGRWELVRSLGRGGMGEVWLARDPARGEEVALKRLLAASPGSESVLRFQREADAILRLRHPAVVAWRDAGIDESGRPWLAMELVPGGSLAERITRGGPLAPREAVDLALDLCRGLAAVHASGTLHRDLKPANVLLDEQGRPKLTDFGLARETRRGASLTETGTIMGSPGYMAPEQVTGEKDALGTATDVYGLGATLYCCLTSHAPFEAASALLCLEAILDQPPGPPSRLAGGVPPALDAIVLRCLAKSPAERWPSAMALHTALAKLRDTPTPRGRGWLVAGAALFVAIALTSLAIWYAFFRTYAIERFTPATDPSPAAASSSAAVSSDPVEPSGGEARKQRALALVRAARLDLRAKNRSSARTNLDLAVATDRDCFEAYEARGELRLEQEGPSGMLEDLREMSRLAPREVALWMKQADAELQLGVSAAAIKSYTRVIELDPGHREAFHSRGMAYQNLRDFSAAKADFDRAIALGGSDALTYYHRGVCLAELGEHQAALADYDEADKRALSGFQVSNLRKRREASLKALGR